MSGAVGVDTTTASGYACFVVPCYDEGSCVDVFHSEFARVFDAGCPVPWRLVMVDDGSADDTWVRLKAVAEGDPRVSAIGFSRNFGKEAAMLAGLRACRDAGFVGFIDADLQQRPEVALEILLALIGDDTVDCVAAYQERRREGMLVSAAKGAFYRVFSRSAGGEVVPGASDFRVFRRCVADALLSVGDYHRFSKGLFSWVGFRTLPWPYVPEERAAGKSKWSVASLARYALSGIASFSALPLHAISAMGAVVSLAAFAYVVVLVVKTLALGVDLPGYASTVALVLLLGGIQLLSLGVIGEYLARDYEQGKGRPIYVVRETVGPGAEGARNER